MPMTTAQVPNTTLVIVSDIEEDVEAEGELAMKGVPGKSLTDWLKDGGGILVARLTFSIEFEMACQNHSNHSAAAASYMPGTLVPK